MLRALHRALPAATARRLTALTGWLTAAAVLHGVALGLVGVVVATTLDAGEAPVAWLVALAIGVVAFVAVQWAAQMIAFRTGSETARALHLRLGDHIAHLPLGWFTPVRQAGVIDTATSGVPQLMSYPAILLRPAITAVVTPPSAAITLAVLDWRYTVAALVASVVAWYVSRFSHHLAREVDARHHRVTVETADRILEYATLQPVIRTDHHAGDRLDDGAALGHAFRDAAVQARRSTAAVLPGLLLFGITLNTLFAGLAGLGALWVTGGTLTVPAFVGLLVVTARLTAVAATGAELAAALRLHHGALTRLRDVLDTPPLPVGEQPPTTTTDLVTVEHVSFRYGTTPVLDDISFTLPPRGLTAIVGPSGAGKTTVTRLLARFWDPTTGRILLSGADLTSLEPDDLYARIAMVLQDDYLIDTTIGDNIRTGRPSATTAELWHAVRAAGLEPTVTALPDGLDTRVGPAGSRLSGGQRQRVAIARALLKAAPLTLMDEVTSALDPENARIIGVAARRLATSGSVVVIAHDLDTITDADQILVLDHGRIVQRGTHQRLAAQPGRYRELLDAHRARPG